jgi:hypothetical protein
VEENKYRGFSSTEKQNGSASPNQTKLQQEKTAIKVLATPTEFRYILVGGWEK